MAEYMQGILSEANGKVSSGGKAYTVITVAGEKMTAWGKGPRESATALLGQMVSVEYTTKVQGDNEYRNATHIEAAGQTGASPRVPAPAQPQQQAPQSTPNAQPQPGPVVHHVTGKDVCIIRQCCIKAAVEVAKGSDIDGDTTRVVQAAACFESWVLDGFAVPAELDRDRTDNSNAGHLPTDESPTTTNPNELF